MRSWKVFLMGGDAVIVEAEYMDRGTSAIQFFIGNKEIAEFGITVILGWMELQYAKS
jgi:hypothetical protein